MSLILLEKEFVGTGEVKGMKFSQISSTEWAYLYEVRNDDNIHYEVIKRLKTPVCIDFEKRIYSETDFKESYPKANKFGTDAFSFTDKETATVLLHEIKKRN